MEAGTVIQLLIGVLVTIIMGVVTTARAESQRDRTEIIARLQTISEKHYELETRLSILEADFADIDPHPSRHKRP